MILITAVRILPDLYGGALKLGAVLASGDALLRSADCPDLERGAFILAEVSDCGGIGGGIDIGPFPFF